MKWNELTDNLNTCANLKTFKNLLNYTKFFNLIYFILCDKVKIHKNVFPYMKYTHHHQHILKFLK